MMTEIDIEDLFAGSMEFDDPVVREPYSDGTLLFLDEPEIEHFTSEGVAERLVYRVGESTELMIEELITGSMGSDIPVIRDPVNAGNSYEIPIGARPVFPGDTFHLLDFEEDFGRDLQPAIDRGLVMVGITSRRAVLLGGLSDSGAGFNSLGIIEFLVAGLNQDLLS